MSYTWIYVKIGLARISDFFDIVAVLFVINIWIYVKIGFSKSLRLFNTIPVLYAGLHGSGSQLLPKSEKNQKFFQNFWKLLKQRLIFSLRHRVK